MSKFIMINEDIGGDFREVAINLAAVQEIREAGDFVTFVFAGENTTDAPLDEALRAALASHGIVFSENAEVAKAA